MGLFRRQQLFDPSWRPGPNDAGALLVLAALAEACGPRTWPEIAEAVQREARGRGLTRICVWYFDVVGRARRGLDRLIAAGLVTPCPGGSYDVTETGLEWMQRFADEQECKQ